MWLELKPGEGLDNKPHALQPLLDKLATTKTPIRFLMTPRTSDVTGGKVMKFYLEVDTRLVKFVTTMIKNAMKCEIVELQSPPVVSGHNVCEFHLKSHYGMPLHGSTDLDHNPIDLIANLLYEKDYALEIFAVPDNKYKSSVARYANNIEAPGTSRKRRIMIEMLSAITHQKPEPPGKRQLDPAQQQVVSEAHEKYKSNLFRVDVFAFGDNSAHFDLIPATLPTQGMNGLAIHKIHQGTVDYDPDRYKHFNITNGLYKWTPFAAYLLMWVAGWTNPLDWIRPLWGQPGPTLLDWLALISSGVVGMAVAGFTHVYNPIVLSSKELSSVVGLPSKIDVVPIDKGLPGGTHSTLPVSQGLKEFID
jgi:hypothetical protein